MGWLTGDPQDDNTVWAAGQPLRRRRAALAGLGRLRQAARQRGEILAGQCTLARLLHPGGHVGQRLCQHALQGNRTRRRAGDVCQRLRQGAADPADYRACCR